MRWRRKRMDLVERLKPYITELPPHEGMVDADPIRMFLVRWMIDTGDPIEVVAKGFGVHCKLLEALVNREVRMISATVAHQLSDRLGSHPADD